MPVETEGGKGEGRKEREGEGEICHSAHYAYLHSLERPETEAGRRGREAATHAEPDRGCDSTVSETVPAT